MLTDAFRGHGTFIYLAASTLAKFNDDPGLLVAALRKAGMRHAWVRLHDHERKPEPYEPTKRLVDALSCAGIALAGWGFVRGWDTVKEAEVAAEQCKAYSLSHFVADIEQDEHASRWDPEKIASYLKQLRKLLPPQAQIVVSSYPYIVGKHPELMRAAVPHVDGFAPQIYWLDYPAAYMLERNRLPPNPTHAYNPKDHLHNPAIYADLCLDWWRHTVGTTPPLILTGQAYWEGQFPSDQAEKKLRHFLRDFRSWSRVVGANWWHLGHRQNLPDNGAMTAPMFDAIVAERLADKPFAS